MRAETKLAGQNRDPLPGPPPSTEKQKGNFEKSLERNQSFSPFVYFVFFVV
jgi:hypothetical protein